MKKILFLMFTIALLSSCSDPANDAVTKDTEIPFEIYQKVELLNNDSIPGYYHIIEDKFCMYIIENKNNTEYSIQRIVKKQTVPNGEVLFMIVVLFILGLVTGLCVKG